MARVLLFQAFRRKIDHEFPFFRDVEHVEQSLTVWSILHEYFVTLWVPLYL